MLSRKPARVPRLQRSESKMQKVQIKVRKVYVFFFLFMIIVGVTVFGLSKAADEYSRSVLPEEELTDITLVQLEPVNEDAPRAVISTTAGDISVVLYNDKAPNAVNLFLSKAELNEFNDINIGLYEQSSIFTVDIPSQESYKTELNKDLWPFKGALCMTESGDIIFVNTIQFSDEDKEYLSAEGELYEVRKAFLEHGGVPDYSRQYAVFGQVISGMDVLEKIAQSPVDTVITITSVKADIKSP